MTLLNPSAFERWTAASLHSRRTGSNLLLAVLGLLATATPVAVAESPPLAPAFNWVLPIFTPEGFRSMTLRGTEARMLGRHAVDVVDMNLTIFSGNAANHVETVILSPAARFLTDRNLASGAKGVRLIRDDLEVTGEQWTYDHAGKKVSIARHVRVVFHAQLHDILK